MESGAEPQCPSDVVFPFASSRLCDFALPLSEVVESPMTGVVGTVYRGLWAKSRPLESLRNPHSTSPDVAPNPCLEPLSAFVTIRPPYPARVCLQAFFPVGESFSRTRPFNPQPLGVGRFSETSVNCGVASGGSRSAAISVTESVLGTHLVLLSIVAFAVGPGSCDLSCR